MLTYNQVKHYSTVKQTVEQAETLSEFEEELKKYIYEVFSQGFVPCEIRYEVHSEVYSFQDKQHRLYWKCLKGDMQSHTDQGWDQTQEQVTVQFHGAGIVKINRYLPSFETSK